jgi:iron complex transport system ATP-binding protein
MIYEVSDLHFSYNKKREVLQGVSFCADKGDFICLLGENGAGKTTLFRCMLGLLKGYRGSIEVADRPLESYPARELAKHIAYIPQEHRPTFNYTVLQTALMGTTPTLSRFRSPGKSEEATALESLDRLGIRRLAESGFAEISGGERQLVLIARALAQHSEVLIMDEPTANLDYGNQIRVMRTIRALASEGYLILLSTHNPEHALQYSEKVLVMRSGKTDLFGKTREVLTESVLTELYNVPVKVHEIRTQEGLVPVCLPIVPGICS